MLFATTYILRRVELHLYIYCSIQIAIDYEINAKVG